jgi:hypothetical protein
MAEAVPPPPMPPAKEPDPVEGSEEWHRKEENKTKHKNFGAGIGFTSDQQIRSFVFEMTFKSQIDEATTVINLYTPHKNFHCPALCSNHQRCTCDANSENQR